MNAFEIQFWKHQQTNKIWSSRTFYLSNNSQWKRTATLKTKYRMFIYNSFHYTENDPKSDLKVFVQTLMWYASDRITIPNFLLAAGKKKKKKIQKDYRIHSQMQNAKNGTRAKQSVWNSTNTVLKQLDHKKQLANTHASLQTH